LGGGTLHSAGGFDRQAGELHHLVWHRRAKRDCLGEPLPTHREQEKTSLYPAIVQASLERLSPILMTALCAALGLLALALSAGEPGSELLAPLAVVVLVGLISSTLLNLFVIPAGYALVFGARLDDSAAASLASRTVPLAADADGSVPRPTQNTLLKETST
jgi:predicted RND superfamily exporter protein